MSKPTPPRVGLSDNKSDNKTEETCPWYINSPKHFNCFWLYVKDSSSIDGSMPELVQSQIAQLLGWSNTKTHFMLKQAMVELIEALRNYNAKELISNGESAIIDPTIFSVEPISYPSEDTEE